MNQDLYPEINILYGICSQNTTCLSLLKCLKKLFPIRDGLPDLFIAIRILFIISVTSERIGKEVFKIKMIVCSLERFNNLT